MAHGLSLKLQAIQPTDRVHKAMPPSARRRPKEAAHTRIGPQRTNVGVARGFHRPDAAPHAPSTTPALWATTRPRPWAAKARRRAANKVARATRKANR